MARLSAGALGLCCACAGPLGARPAASEAVVVDSVGKRIEFRAVYRPDQFNSGTGLKQHHFVVWEGGKAARLALLDALSADSAIHDALVRAGGTPGNNLTADSWNERANARSPDPDLVAAGSPLALLVLVAGRELPPESLLTDLNAKPCDLCFAGNRALIPVWRSGCVVCLQSCPGSKISNRTYTMRDLYRHVPRFAVRPVAQLNAGDTVTLRVRIKDGQ
jgi:hypothetical protein